MKKIQSIPPFLLTLAFAVLAVVVFYRPSVGWISTLLSVSVINALRGQKSQFDVLSLIPVFAVGQLLWAPAYLNSLDHGWLNYSPMPLGEYFNYGIPLCISFVLPFFFNPRKGTSEYIDSLKHDLILKGEIDQHHRLAKVLICVGLASQILFVLFRELPIVGALLAYGLILWKAAIPILVFDLKHYRAAFFLFALVVANSWYSTLWWDVFMWIVLTAAYGIWKGRVSLSRLAIVGIIVGVGATTIQTVKHVQRSGLAVEFTELISTAQDIVEVDKRQNMTIGVVGRMNQAIHDSFVYRRIQDNSPKINSILESFIGSFMPRALYSAKPKFSSDKFRDFTGYDLMGYSFITMSGCAEAAANFGVTGGCVFLFVWSAILRLLYHGWLMTKLKSREVILLTIPFFHVIRVEVDFFHWFCGIFYGSMVVFAVISYLRRIE